MTLYTEGPVLSYRLVPQHSQALCEGRSVSYVQYVGAAVGSYAERAYCLLLISQESVHLWEPKMTLYLYALGSRVQKG